MRFQIRDLITRELIGEANTDEEAQKLADAYNATMLDDLATDIIDTEEEIE